MKESPLFVKTYDFSRWLLDHTRSFPKNQRFVMARRIEEAVPDFYDLLLMAVIVERARENTLQKASLQLEKLKHYLRLSHDMALINLRQYEYSSVAMVEIGQYILSR